MAMATTEMEMEMEKKPRLKAKRRNPRNLVSHCRWTSCPDRSVSHCTHVAYHALACIHAACACISPHASCAMYMHEHAATHMHTCSVYMQQQQHACIHAASTCINVHAYMQHGHAYIEHVHACMHTACTCVDMHAYM